MNHRQWIGVVLGFCFAACTFAADPAQVPPKPDAYLPAGVRAAKSVFLSNAGIDWRSQSALDATQELPFNVFARAMQTWGRYQLADSPAAADMVLQFRVVQEFAAFPSIYVNFVDVKTGVILWTVRTDVTRKSIRNNLDEVIQNLKAVVP